MSFRTWASIITVAVLALVVFFARHEIYKAWEILKHLNPWILFLLIPVQFVAYFSAGEGMFSYLRDKKLTSGISPLLQARMALEMNFVNHALPSGGVSGISYMTWRLGKFGISPGKATVAQLVRFVSSFIAFIILIFVSVIAVTIDGSVNRVIILLSALVIIMMLTATFGMILLVSSKRRAEVFGRTFASTGNRIIQFVTLGKKTGAITAKPITRFFLEMHDEYLILRHEPKIFIKPILWGIVVSSADTLMFIITFWALGATVNPAVILIAWGLASSVGAIFVTPGGTGAFEAIMVYFLATAGIDPGLVIAGVLITRVSVLMGTIGFGYIFYQLALLQYGKPKITT